MLQHGDTLLALTLVTPSGDTTESTDSLMNKPKMSRRHQPPSPPQMFALQTSRQQGGDVGTPLSLTPPAWKPKLQPFLIITLHFIIQPRMGEN